MRYGKNSFLVMQKVKKIKNDSNYYRLQHYGCNHVFCLTATKCKTPTRFSEKGENKVVSSGADDNFIRGGNNVRHFEKNVIPLSQE